LTLKEKSEGKKKNIILEKKMAKAVLKKNYP
jgi:hypothetical protein